MLLLFLFSKLPKNKNTELTKAGGRKSVNKYNEIRPRLDVRVQSSTAAGEVSE